MARKKPEDNIAEIATALTAPAWINDLPQTGTPLDVAGRIYRQLEELHNGTPGIIAAAAENDDLSERGKGKAKHAAGETQLVPIAKLKAEAEKVLGGAIEKARSNRPECTPEKVMADISLAAETRRWLFEAHGQDALMLETTLREAEAAGDIATIDAVLTAPASWPLAKSFDRDEWTQRRAALADADLGPATLTLIQAQADLSARFEWVAEAIKSEAGISDSETVEDLAGGNIA